MPRLASRPLLEKTATIAWAPLAVVALHGVLSRTIGHHTEFDPFFHFFGGVAGAYSLLRAWEVLPFLSTRLPSHRNRYVVLIVSAAALTWEIGEFAKDKLFGSHIQRGWLDTYSDVALGIAGAAMVAWLIAPRRPQKRQL